MMEPARSRPVELLWRLGARTATLIAERMTPFACSVHVCDSTHASDAKSIFALMMLGEFPAGSRLQLQTRGVDAEAAMKVLEEIFTAGERIERCREPGCESRPCLTDLDETTIAYGCYDGHSWQVARQPAAKPT